ncbi:hypothetical protein KKD62_04045 [Patescibacteria group bacterium]|nr:hypothetical protein [Patescibacteria group bacterium]MBU1931566.1 hypothetical protein [Patescibacteria group bacterium]
MAKYKKSWLQKKEERRSLSQAALFGLATLVSLLLLLFLGVPALIKLAAFLGDLKSSTLMVEKDDNLAPIPPSFNYLADATDQETISLSGRSEPGSIIKISLNGSFLKEVITGKSGEFNLESVKLSQGKNTIYATAWDAAGNKSLESESLIIYFDQEAPTLEIIEPVNGARFFEEEKQIQVIGTTEEDTQVTVNDRRAIVDLQGNFSVAISLSDGNNELKITAIDKAGNQTEQTITVEYIP